MSAYQADWFVDEQGKWEGDEDEDEEENMQSQNHKILEKSSLIVGGGGGSASSGGGLNMSNGDDSLDIDRDSGGDNNEDEDEEEDMSFVESAADQGQSKQFADRRNALTADQDREFPDEVDTPEDIAARVRFARYRNLQSFRSSSWDPKENLPLDYSRIFQFQNFQAAQRKILSDGKHILQLQEADIIHRKNIGSSISDDINTGVMIDPAKLHSDLFVEGAEFHIRSGQYVSITLANVPNFVVQLVKEKGYLAIFGLLEHENKQCVLNFNVKRREEYQEPIRSKDQLIFMAGFRTFDARPIFSEANLNCDKNKLERFLQHDRFSIASVFAPITFMPCPLLIFKRIIEGGNNKIVLVATGNLASIDPDRIVLKKIILTGIPVRVRKKSAVIKHMFYNPQVFEYLILTLIYVYLAYLLVQLPTTYYSRMFGGLNLQSSQPSMD